MLQELVDTVCFESTVITTKVFHNGKVNLDRQKKWLFLSNKDFYFNTSQTNPPFYVSVVRKHRGNWVNCSKQAICPFPQVLSTRLENVSSYASSFNCHLQTFLSLDDSKICCLE